MIDAAVAGAVKQATDGVYATLRKSGALGNGNNGNGGTPGTAPAAPPSNGDGPKPPSSPPAGYILAADVEKMLEERDTIASLIVSHSLTPKQASRLRAAVKADRPDDTSAFGLSYLEDLGLLKGAQPPPATTTQQATATPAIPILPLPGAQSPPISDKGAPAGGPVVDWKRELYDNPVGFGGAAKERLVAEVGLEKANRMIMEAVQTKGSMRISFVPK